MTTMTTSATSEPSETWSPPPEFAADLLDRYGLTCPPRWGTPRNPNFPSLGPKLWKVMTALGAPPMPWQKYVTDVALEIDPRTDLFVHREVGLSVSRQQGKPAALAEPLAVPAPRQLDVRTGAHLVAAIEIREPPLGIEVPVVLRDGR